MWNRRNDEAAPPQRAPEPRPASVQPQPSTPTPGPTTTYSATPKRISTLGSSVIVKGEIHTKEELVVDGELEGSLESSDRLTVGATGKVRAQVKAKEVTVRGQVKGNVHASDRITIHKDASLVGDVKTAGIVIEDGAYFKGSIDILRPETPKHEPRQVQKENNTSEAVAAASSR